MMSNPSCDVDDSMDPLLFGSPGPQGDEAHQMLDGGPDSVPQPMQHASCANQLPQFQDTQSEQENWSQVKDMGMRRKIQNRNAQRTFRARRRGLEQCGHRTEPTPPPPTNQQATPGPSLHHSSVLVNPGHGGSDHTTTTSLGLSRAYEPPATVQMAEIERQSTMPMSTGARRLHGPHHVPLHNPGYLSPGQELNSTATFHITGQNHSKSASKALTPILHSSPSISGDGRTTLHLAAETGNLRIVQMLLMQDLCNYGARDSEGQTALHVAAQRGHYDVVQEFLMRIASVPSSLEPEPAQAQPQADGCSAPNCRQCTLTEGGRAGASGSITDRHAAAVLDVGDVRGRTALHLAAEAGHEGVAELLLQARADVNVRDRAGLAPLHVAAIQGDEGMVRLLLDFNADHLSPVRID